MRSIATFVLLVFSICAIAQVDHIGRFEADYNWGTDDFLVIPNDDRGLLIVNAERIPSGKTYPIHFNLLNNKFESVWKGSMDISKKLGIKGFGYGNGYNFLLLQEASQNSDLKIVKIDPNEGFIKEFSPKRLTEIEITEFEIIQNSVVIGGYIENRPAVFVYDTENESLKTLNNVYQNKSELLEIKVNEDSVTFNVVVSVLNERKDKTIQVNTYDFEGSPVRDYRLGSEVDYQLLTAMSSSIFNVEQVIVGLYSIKVGTSPSGIYVNHVDRTGQQSMRYMPFGEFNSFFNHEGERRSEKLKQKSLEASRSDKNFRYKTEGVFRKMIEEDNQLVMLVEFFKPLSSSEFDFHARRNRLNPFYYANGANNFPNSNWVSSTSNMNALETREYDFTHAFAFAIDKSGNLKWDYHYEIDDQVNGLLTSYGEFIYHEQNVFFSFYDDKELIVDHMNNVDEEKEQDVSELTLLNEVDELKFENESQKGILRWHDNKYLIFGIHHIRSTERGAPLRKVFFVNGVSVGPNFVKKEIED